MITDHKLISLINIDPLKNIAVSGFFSNYPVEEYFIEGESAIIFGKSDNLWAHIISSSESELTILLKMYSDKTDYYFSVEDWMIPLILKHGNEDWIMKTNRYIIDDDVYVGIPESDMISLDSSHATYMYENSEYKDMNSPEYFEDNLSRDISCGIIKDNKLVAWGFAHDDGALGSLHVMPEYRRKGYAKDILSGLIYLRRNDQRPVFGNVVLGNTASIKLLTKFGFKFDRRVSWLKINHF